MMRMMMMMPSPLLVIVVALVLLPTAVNARRRLWNELGLNHTNVGRHLSLLGHNVDVPTPTSPDDHLVTDLPLLDQATFPTNHWAGLLPASDSGDKYLFYWLFAPDDTSSSVKKDDADIPLIIWLNGGPACSSMDGLWLENGPFRLTPPPPGTAEWSIELDEYSWHKAPAYVVYIDQPVGTGISFTTSGKYPKNDVEVNVDFYYFLQQFLTLHKDTLGDRPLYFSGESHAGHYIPSMMNYIQQQNDALQLLPDATNSKLLNVNLAGAAIGNGWMDPMVQYSAHEVGYGYGLVGRAQKRALAATEVKCQADLQRGKYVSQSCFGLLDAVVENSQGKGSLYTVSQYDQRKWEQKAKPRDFPPGHKTVENYLGGWGSLLGNQFDYLKVLEAIHSMPSKISGQRYKECTDPPYNALKHQDGKGVTEDVVALLNHDFPMLFFNGIHDLICNHVGNEIAVENLAWNGQSDYQLAKRYGWKSPSTQQLGGYMKEYKNLMYLKVLDSGHMVPMDVPDVSLDIVRTFIYQQSFDSFEQSLRTSLAQSQESSCPVCPKVTPPIPVPSAETPSEKVCPTCPTCPTESESESESTNSNANDALPPKDSSSIDANTNTNDGMHTISVNVPDVPNTVVLGTALASSILLLCLCYFCCCRRSSSSHTRIKLRQREGDMELPQRDGGFRDEPSDRNGN